MVVTAQTAAPASIAKARKKREKKVSPQRAAAELAYKNAKSDQEKTAARGAVKVIRFREIVVPRVNRVLQQLSRLEKMANRSAYTWTEEEASKIVTALTKKLQAIHGKFTGSKSEKDSFAL